MSDKMTPIPFPRLMKWILEEKKTRGTVFGVRRPYRASAASDYGIFGGQLETPFGVAAGPHTQLAQNLVAAYYAGSRFFELKTVQILDGEDLPVPKPCIKADDECYNVEWSTELYVPQAFEEYVKAWFAIHVLAIEWGLGREDGFQFNMSVGYDLEGIKSEKLDRFIEGLKDAKNTPIFQECRSWLFEHIDLFQQLTPDDIKGIPATICSSATLSTLHGCPPQEIERIARYLLEEKKVHTFIKCNPTLLGYDYVRSVMDDMGYNDVAFGDFHFADDLQYTDAVPLIKRLMETAQARNLEFGVKISNTLPVDIKAGELPGEEMYMSGKALYPLSLAVAAKLAAEFNGKLRISYSGGADYFNIEKIVAAGIWPVTMATTLLKPGGYQRLEQIAEVFSGKEPQQFTSVNAGMVQDLVEKAKSDPHHRKALKPLPSRKMKKQVPLFDCFIASCQEGCPIRQDIPAYMKLAGEGKMKEALRVIIDKNPLPFITGTICAHNCMTKCNRNYYEAPVNIRRTKLDAAKGGFADLLKELKEPELNTGKKAAVVGGGPSGLAAAYFLAREGMAVTVFEKEQIFGGIVRHVIPDFRISGETIDRDIELIRAMGVRFVPGKEITSVKELQNEYDSIILAVGAYEPGILKLEQGQALNALDFLRQYKQQNNCLNIGKRVVVIGGGNTAMDTARAAKRIKGVEQVILVYRRTKRYMPADEEELQMAIADGVEFRELLSPLRLVDGFLVCQKMKLTEMNANGRREVAATGELVELPADTVIAAVGEKVPAEFFRNNGLETDSLGHVVVNEQTLESSQKGVYVIGDGLGGPATVVEAIRDAGKAAEAILKKSIVKDYSEKEDPAAIFEKKGRLAEEDLTLSDSRRCLHCDTVCENCVDVCPNRANVAIEVHGMSSCQILHVDYMCNECGNCKSFCPYDSGPYLDKLTLFATEQDFLNSKNNGFVINDHQAGTGKIRLDGKISDYRRADTSSEQPDNLRQLIETVMDRYTYLF